MAVTNYAVLRDGIQLGNAVAVNQILDEDTMSSDSAEAIPTQQSVKKYVDDNIGVQISGTPVDNQLAIWTNATTIEGNSDLYFDATNNYLGIGTDSPGASVHAVWEGANTLALTRYGDVTGPPGLNFYKHRGAVGSEADVQVGDDIGSFFAHGYLNSAYQEGGFVDFEVASVTSNILAVNMFVGLRDTSDVRERRFSFTYDNKFGIGTESPATDLEIVNDVETGSKITATKVYAGGNAPVFQGRHARGTIGSEADIIADDVLCSLHGWGYVNGGYVDSAYIDLRATSVSGTDVECAIEFYTKDSGSLTQKLAINSDGALEFTQMSAPTTTTNRLYNVAGDLFWNGTQLGQGSPAGSDGEIQYKNGTAFGGASGLYYDDTNHRLGVGTTSPDYLLEAVSESAPYLGVTYYNTNSSSPQIIQRKGRGTEASPTDVSAGDVAAIWAANAYINSGWDRVASMQYLVNDTHTTYASGYILWKTSDTSGNFDERLRIEQDGALKFAQMSAPGTTTDKLYNVSGSLYWNGTDLTGFVDASGTPADGQIAVWTDATTIEGSSDFTFSSGSMYVREDSGYASYWALAYGSGASEYGRSVVGRSRGTQASPTAIQSGDALGAYQFFGQYATGSWNKGASVESFATENWSSGNYGCDMVFNTTANTAGSQTERMRITQAGYVGIGTDDPNWKFGVVGTTLDEATVSALRFHDGGTGGSCLKLFGSRGTEGTPVTRSSGDALGTIHFGGYDGNSFEIGTLIHSVTTEAWSDTGRGCELQFYVIENASTSFIQAITVANDGSVKMPKVYDDTVTSSRDLEIQSDGKIGYVSSAKRNKKYIKKMDSVKWIEELNPVTFQFKKDKRKEKQYGFIAEQVEEINKDFVFYNSDYQIDGVYYKKFIPVLIKAEQETRKELRRENQELRKRIEKLEITLEKLAQSGKVKRKSKTKVDTARSRRPSAKKKKE